MQTRVTLGVLIAAVGAVLIGQAARPQPSQPPAPGDRPTGPVSPESCAECHADVKQRGFVHGPVSVNACATCHTVDSVDRHTFKLARQGTGLCTYCHDVDLDDMAVLHEPLATGDCTGCHDPHGGADRALLRAPSVDDLCKTCHGDVTGGSLNVHGPVAVGACSACHLPHASPHAGLLRLPARELCTSCHVTTQTQLDTMRVVHEPATGDCGVCHNPHASDHGMMLRDEPQALCMECHEPIRHTVETAATQHAAVTTERQCLNCHNPHASDHPRVLADDMLTLCLECHDREIDLPDGRKLADMKQILETGMSLHGPVAQHNCAACHMIHGGENFRMLIREYPPEFYAPFAEERYALCFGCHDKQLVYDRHTTSLTNFRNGDLNLHYVHVNRERKGRSCRACHETHAANNAKHIRESVPFGAGGWELPVGYKPTETGGSCAPGCHRRLGYDRVDPVVYPDPPGPATWPREGPTADGSGASAPREDDR